MSLHNIIIFSDLDGSLLDHNDYSFTAAKPLLQQLKDTGIPVIFNTSKTQPEIKRIQQEMNFDMPFITENGAAIYFTNEQSKKFIHTSNKALEQLDDYKIKRFALYYEQLLSVANSIREKYKFHYRGFSDMTTAQIAELTQLSQENAYAASLRHFSEPILWQDNQTRLLQFQQLLAEQNIKLIEGGRFFHLSGQYSKGEAMQWFLDHCTDNKTRNRIVIALGDNRNDVSMLNKSDYAIIIKNKTQKLLAQGKIQTIYSSLPGTAGWVETLSTLLNKELSRLTSMNKE